MSVISNSIKELNGKEILGMRILSILLVLISYVPLKIPLTSSFIVHVDFMVIYFWSIYSENVCSKAFLILFGLICDSIYGQPLGMTSVICLIFNFALANQRNVFLTESFYVVWLGFALFSFFGIMFKICLFFIASEQIIFSEIMFYNWLISFASYVVIHGLFSFKITKEKSSNA